jgi:hypothetical protein
VEAARRVNIIRNPSLLAEITSKRSGTKAKSGGEAKPGKRRTKKESLKDLEAKDSQKISGGKVASSDISVVKYVDKSTPTL